MRPGRGYRQSLAGALFAGPIASVAAIQVVGDAACGYYDVDIAAFATCVDGRVVKPESAPAMPPMPRREAHARPFGDALDSASAPAPAQRR